MKLVHGNVLTMELSVKSLSDFLRTCLVYSRQTVGEVSVKLEVASLYLSLFFVEVTMTLNCIFVEATIQNYTFVEPTSLYYIFAVVRLIASTTGDSRVTQVTAWLYILQICYDKSRLSR